MYFEYQITESIPRVVGSQVILESVNEFNTHQQDSWSKTKNTPRKNFADSFNLSHIDNDKNIVAMTEEHIQWWNTEISKKISPLTVSKYLTGNNPTGSQKKKKNAEFVVSDGEKMGLPFFNLLKVFAMNTTIQTKSYSSRQLESAISFDEFLDDSAKMDDEVNNVINNFFEKRFLYFYVDEMKEHLDILGDDSTDAKLRRKFRMNLISTFERKDQLYNVFSARKMVEAAHIKPFSHAENDEEKIDIDNGILLSPDIHKLFDSGAISFNKNGGIIYSTNKNHTPYNLTTMEVQRLELDNHSLNQELLTEKRRAYLEYHRNNIYGKGV